MTGFNEIGLELIWIIVLFFVYRFMCKLCFWNWAIDLCAVLLLYGDSGVYGVWDRIKFIN